MKILVTGAKGFVGKNLCAALKNLKDGKDKTRPALLIEDIFEYDIDSNPADLDIYWKRKLKTRFFCAVALRDCSVLFCRTLGNFILCAFSVRQPTKDVGNKCHGHLSLLAEVGGHDSCFSYLCPPKSGVSAGLFAWGLFLPCSW